MNKLSQREIKESVLNYLNEHAEYTSPSGLWQIAFYSKDGGVYSGVSRVDNRVYGFIVNFADKYFSIQGISGKDLKKSAGNLNNIFGRENLVEAAESSKVLNKFNTIGNALGRVPETDSSWYGTTKESDNGGRGIYRAITVWPVAEQLTEMPWFIAGPSTSSYDSNTVSDMRSLLNALQELVTKSGKSNLRKALKMPASYFKEFSNLSSIHKAKRYLEIPSSSRDLMKQAKDIAEQVDKERGYHNADEWSNKFNGVIGSEYYYLRSKVTKAKDFLNSSDNWFKNLVRYLYGSCYHQQALEPGEALGTLDDYYDSVAYDRNPVKFPRYLRTAHDVAAANMRARKDEGNNIGVYQNWIKHNYLECTFGDWAVAVGATPAEITDEANQQSNCVAGYIGSVAKQETTILFLRKKNDMHRSQVTFEVREGAIVQAFATFNRNLDDKQSIALCQFAKANDFDFKLNAASVNITSVIKPRLGKLSGFHNDDDLKNIIESQVSNSNEFNVTVISA